MKEMFQGQGAPPDVSVGGENMLAPDEVAAMVRLKSLGWGTRKIAAALGCSRTTVKRYVEAGGFVAYRQPQRGGGNVARTFPDYGEVILAKGPGGGRPRAGR